MTVILDNLAEGLGREEILRSYPTLEPIHIDAALAYAAELAREESLLPLKPAWEAYSQVLGQPDRDRFLEDKTLHLRFAALARNRTLLAALEQVLDRTIMKLRVEELPRERGPAAHAEHLRVVDALRARDLARATAELRAHIRTSRAYIVANLEAKASRPEAAASERRPRRAWPPPAAKPRDRALVERSRGPGPTFDLASRRAVVTGAASGIGRATSLAFAEAGADLVLADVDEAGLAPVAQEVRELGRQVLPLRIDVGVEADAQTLAKAAVETFGGVDILVNSAGINVRRPVLEYPADEVERILRVDLLGVLHCCRALGALMVGQRRGAIVNISSILDTVAVPQRAIYMAAKGGVRQLTRALAIEWAAAGVRVNAVSPGYCRTALTAPTLDDPAVIAHVQTRIPLRRVAEPREIASAILFLASDAASYVTGTVLYVDGGYTAA